MSYVYMCSKKWMQRRKYSLADACNILSCHCLLLVDRLSFVHDRWHVQLKPRLFYLELSPFWTKNWTTFAFPDFPVPNKRWASCEKWIHVSNPPFCWSWPRWDAYGVLIKSLAQFSPGRRRWRLGYSVVDEPHASQRQPHQILGVSPALNVVRPTTMSSKVLPLGVISPFWRHCWRISYGHFFFERTEKAREMIFGSHF
jgi:hypothetical protein